MSKLASVLLFLACVLILLVPGCSSSTSSRDSGSAIRTLVLGSGGFLGQRLVEHLEQRGHLVAQVTGREHVDLRSQAALLDFEKREGPFDFVFFIACEVGGAKYLEKEQSQPAILRHNVQMYESVFPWAKERGIPLLFTSSYMRCVVRRSIPLVRPCCSRFQDARRRLLLPVMLLSSALCLQVRPGRLRRGEAAGRGVSDRTAAAQPRPCSAAVESLWPRTLVAAQPRHLRLGGTVRAGAGHRQHDRRSGAAPVPARRRRCSSAGVAV